MCCSCLIDGGGGVGVGGSSTFVVAFARGRSSYTAHQSHDLTGSVISMRAAGHSFRNACRFSHKSPKFSRKAHFSANNPALRWVWSTLFWLPTFTVFTQVGCTIRAVTGDSMQVRETALVVPPPPCVMRLFCQLADA